MPDHEEEDASSSSVPLPLPLPLDADDVDDSVVAEDPAEDDEGAAAGAVDGADPQRLRLRRCARRPTRRTRRGRRGPAQEGRRRGLRWRCPGRPPGASVGQADSEAGGFVGADGGGVVGVGGEHHEPAPAPAGEARSLAGEARSLAGESE